MRIFVMGANRWRDEEAWPIARTRFMPLYLGPGKSLQSETRRARSGPVCLPSAESGPNARRSHLLQSEKCFHGGLWINVESRRRDDVLVYSTPPLKQDLEVTGEVRAVLHVATSAPDTDFTAKLVDVFPDGHARNLCDGILRMRYRKGLGKPELIRPGEVYAITVPAGVTSNVFKTGHRIRSRDFEQQLSKVRSESQYGPTDR